VHGTDGVSILKEIILAKKRERERQEMKPERKIE
jgi:hypothetical protein